MILFFMGALMGSGFASTQGDSQAAIATGHAQRQKHLERRRKFTVAPQSAPSMPSVAWGVKHYAHGHFSGVRV
ncbi:hypothetical protein CWC48_04385 [Pseudomonas sp. S10E 269]|nr:hypothetical protein B1R45_06370 [Pseudomonas azotoformans]PIB41681.1 hypothetical protein AOA57_27580 [Pseudomonas sp. 2588-5]PJK34455.1 hypothetical protein CWC49_14545 [Pseudomonas sp. S09F 262]PJK38397.1 hypothetical protein CWC48_04385 [Pseudomonas sp. S10E 269]